MGEEPVAAQERDGDGHDAPPGGLYVVATPLGNLADLSARARATLASAHRVLAEDTRVTAVLLRHAGVATRPTSLHEHNEQRRVPEVLGWLAAGERVALVSDAGTPAISDPGARLVRAAHAAGHRVVPVPGPSAVAAAVSAAGLDAERFVYAGFLPSQAKARRALLDALARLPCAIVVYEAPHRVRATVEALHAALGARTLVVARELTKRFEQVVRLPLAEAAAWLDADAHRTRGEFVLVVDAAQAPAAEAADDVDEATQRWLAALVVDLPPAAAARVASRATGLPRERLYACALALRGAADPPAR